MPGWNRTSPTIHFSTLADAETLCLSAEGRVRSLGQKARSLDEIQGQYIGLFKVRADRVPKLLEVYRSLDREERYDGEDFDGMYMTTFLQVLIDRGWAVQAAPIRNGWLELDSVDDLRLYEQMHAEGTLGSFCKL